MDQRQDELYDLQPGQILLPPQVRLKWFPGREAIVTVHDDMDEEIDEGKETADWDESEFDTDPETNGDGGMMKDVQETNMWILFTQDKENRVQEVKESWNEH